jgi:hypothetical protein
VAKFRAGFAGDVRMVVDDQPDVRAPGYGQNLFGHPADFVGRGFFGAELDQIRAAVAELLRKDFRRAAMKVGRVNKSVKPAVRERFHGPSLTTKHTKHTKEFRDFRRSCSIRNAIHKRSRREIREASAVTSAPLSVRNKITRLSNSSPARQRR